MSGRSGWRPWLVASAVAALVGWWAAPLPEPASDFVKPRRDSWRLPPLPRRTDQTSVAAMVGGASYWGGAAAAPGAGKERPEDPGWRIAAVYGVGTDRGVLVQFAAPSKPPLRLRAGDALPSGHRIVKIGERDVCVQIGRKAFWLGVERSGS